MDPYIMGETVSWLSGCCGCLLLLGYLVIHGVCGWLIFRKAGFEPVLGLLLVIPVLNVVILIYLAVSSWPIEKELKYFMNEATKVKKDREEITPTGLKREGKSELFD